MKQRNISLFKEVMGTSPSVKVLEFLIEWNGFDITITDIARGASIGRANAYEIVNTLKSKGILKQTRTIGTSTFYIFNKENEISKKLIDLFNSILKKNLEKEN